MNSEDAIKQGKNRGGRPPQVIADKTKYNRTKNRIDVKNEIEKYKQENDSDR